MVVNGETLGPWGQRSADGMKTAAKSKDMAVAQFSGLWAREGDIFLNVQNGQEHADGKDAWLELNDVRLSELADDGRHESLARVVTPEHRDHGCIMRAVPRTYSEITSVNPTQAWEDHRTSNPPPSARAPTPPHAT